MICVPRRVNPVPANLEVVQSAFGDVRLAAPSPDFDDWASSHRVDRRDDETCGATVDVEAERGDVIAHATRGPGSVSRRRHHAGACRRHRDVHDVDATGLARGPARYFYSRDNCLDVFEDLSCPNDKRSCIDCYGEGH